MLRLIELTFNFSFDKDKVILEKLKKVICKDKILKTLVRRSKDLSEFPLNSITMKGDVFTIKDYVVKGIVQGIFHTNKTLVKQSISGVPVRAIKLKDSIPAGFTNRKLNVSSNIFYLKPRIKSGKIKNSKKPLKLKKTENFNFINSYELIIQKQM